MSYIVVCEFENGSVTVARYQRRAYAERKAAKMQQGVTWVSYSVREVPA